MKNLFDLQLFNDEGLAATATAASTAIPEDYAAGSTGAAPKAETKPADPKNEPKYTDEDLDRIINQKFAKWEKEREKKVTEAERLGKLTAEEKAAEKLKNLETRIHEYEQRELRADMTKQARSILQDANIHVNDDLLGNLIAEDAETTKASVENFISLFNAAVENAVKSKLKSEPPKTGSKASTMTKEQIMAIPNTQERLKKIEENIDLFK